VEKSVTKKFRAILRGEWVLYVKNEKERLQTADITKQAFFPLFPFSELRCGWLSNLGGLVARGKTGRFRYFRSWISLRGHGAVASSAVEVLSLGRDGGPAIVLHGLGCCLRLLGLSP
jgi:hypothetical protein